MSVAISRSFIERHLGGKGFVPVLKSALLGVPLPLCSCGVIPVGASLRTRGASQAATTAFLISTPQTGIDSIMVTLSLLGPVYAVFRPLFALLSGITGGILVELTSHHAHTSVEKLTSPRDSHPDENTEGKLRKIFTYGFLTLPRDIGKALLLGLVAAALISALVPEDFFAPVFGGGIIAMVLMMLVGIPVYVCATASIPVAAALILKAGISPGAAFAFLMTGPATNAATIATIWKIMGKRTALIYLGTVGCAALVGGVILDQLVSAGDVRAAHETARMIPGFVQTACAAALLGLLGIAVFHRTPRETREGQIESGSREIVLEVSGMTCSHCADSVRRAILECEGVESVSVNLETGMARITADNPDMDQMRGAIESLGYRLKSSDKKDEGRKCT